MQRLKQQHVLDDQRLVNQFLQQNTGRKAISNQLLLEKLRQRGAPEMQLCSDQSISIDELLASRFLPHRTSKNIAKASRFLTSRGFDTEQIESAIQRYFTE